MGSLTADHALTSCESLRKLHTSGSPLLLAISRRKTVLPAETNVKPSLLDSTPHVVYLAPSQTHVFDAGMVHSHFDDETGSTPTRVAASHVSFDQLDQDGVPIGRVVLRQCSLPSFSPSSSLPRGEEEEEEEKDDSPHAHGFLFIGGETVSFGHRFAPSSSPLPSHTQSVSRVHVTQIASQRVSSGSTHPTFRVMATTKEIEMLVHTDFGMFSRYNSQSGVLNHVEQVLLLADFHLQNMGQGYRLLIKGVVTTQSTSNPFTATSNTGTNLANMRTWARGYQTTVAHDGGMSIIGQTLNALGLANSLSADSICADKDTRSFYSVTEDRVVASIGITLNSDRSLAITGTTAAHEVGHNLGAQHDDDAGSSCGNGEFIMNGAAGTNYIWSSCSISSIKKVGGTASCLRSREDSTAVFCGAGQYGGSGTSESRCKSCKSHCASCTSSTSCTKCDVGYKLQETTCVSSCGAGYFNEAESSSVTFPSSPTGQACSRCASASLSCDTGFFLNCDVNTGSNPVCEEGTIGGSRGGGSGGGDGGVIAVAILIPLLLIGAAAAFFFYRKKKAAKGEVCWVQLVG